MVQISTGWEVDVERGPDWLFVRPLPPESNADDTPPLAEEIWSLMDQQFAHNVVLELDRIGFLSSYLIGQLLWLHKRVYNHGGMMRVCGLDRAANDVLRQCRLDSRFGSFADRAQAVMGFRPSQPR